MLIVKNIKIYFIFLKNIKNKKLSVDVTKNKQKLLLNFTQKYNNYSIILYKYFYLSALMIISTFIITILHLNFQIITFYPTNSNKTNIQHFENILKTKNIVSILYLYKLI